MTLRPSPPKLAISTGLSNVTSPRVNLETVNTRCLSKRCDYYRSVKFLARGFDEWFLLKTHWDAYSLLVILCDASALNTRGRSQTTKGLCAAEDFWLYPLSRKEQWEGLGGDEGKCSRLLTDGASRLERGVFFMKSGRTGCGPKNTKLGGALGRKCV